MPDPSPTELARELTRGIDALLMNLRVGSAEKDHVRKQLETLRQRAGDLTRSIEAGQANGEVLHEQLTAHAPGVPHRHTQEVALSGPPRIDEQPRENTSPGQYVADLLQRLQETERPPTTARTRKLGFTDLLEALTTGVSEANPRARTQPLPVFADEPQIGDLQTEPRAGITAPENSQRPLPGEQRRPGRTASKPGLALLAEASMRKD